MTYITANWHDTEKRILLIKFTDGWQWDELFQILDQIKVWLDDHSQTVVILFDVSVMTKFPLNIFKHARVIWFRAPHPNVDSMVVVGANAFIKATHRAFQAMLPSSALERWKISFVDTFDEAINRVLPYSA